MLHAAVVRSRHPHARVLAIDTAEARAMPGVAAVLTADDIPGDRINGHVRRDWPILVGVGETVRYMGDAVALVAAESPDLARGRRRRDQGRVRAASGRLLGPRCPGCRVRPNFTISPGKPAPSHPGAQGRSRGRPGCARP